MGQKKGSVMAMATVLWLAVVALLSIYQQGPPAAVPMTASPGEFASGRAMKQLEAIAQKPHPIGSLAHQEVRDYILQQLSAQGLSPEVQETTAAQARGRAFFAAGMVKNIAARLSGTNSSKAVLLVAHYDSTPTSFGASDDGSGVVVLLETLRALKASAPLKNDVIFLFTDGEEVGLLGAKAFIDEHPWARDVGLVLNFEARGNTGPAIMFETSNGNGLLIREFAQAAPFPVANSLASSVYRLLPNATDFTLFKTAGLPGLNFAYIKGLTHYHTALDNFANVDERSLQHQGSYALALTRHFASLDLTRWKANNAVYFSFGPIFINYSQAWVIPLTLLVVLSFIAVVAFGFKQRKLNVAGIGMGFLALGLCAIASAAAVFSIWWLINALFGTSKAVPYGDTYHRDLYLLIFLFLTFAVTSGVLLWFRKKISVPNLLVGALLWWLLLLVLASVFLPAGSYLLAWPLLFALPGLAVTYADEFEVSWLRLVLLFFCAIPAVVLLAPSIYLIFFALNPGMAGLVMIMTVLLLGSLMPLLHILLQPARWLLAGSALALCLALIVTAVVTSGFDRSHPRQDHVFYHLAADKGEAAWLSEDRHPDMWTSQFFPANTQKVSSLEVPLLAGRTLLKSSAPIAPLQAPTIELLDAQPAGDRRTLRLRISSLRQAPIISVHVDPGTEVFAAAVNGKALSDNLPHLQWGLRYFALPPAGLELTLTIRSAGPVKIRVIDQSYGLPEFPGTPLKPRPDGIIPAPSMYSDLTLVDKLLSF